MVAGVVDLVFSAASCAFLCFSAASSLSFEVREVLAWCRDWVFVASGHRVSSWCFGIWFAVVLLRDAVAWGQWVLTQTLTGCPELLLISAPAISVQSCLDVIFGGLWLCLFLLALGLGFTLDVLWRFCPSLPSLRALGRALVPLVCLYAVRFALPGADAMEDSSFSGSSSSDYARTQELSSLSADTWEAFAFYFKNKAKLKRLVLPFRLPLDEVAPDPLDFGCVGDYEDVSEGEDPGDDKAEKPARAAPASRALPFLRGVSIKKFCDQNSTLHGLLGLACAKCVEDRLIHDQFSVSYDGIGAFRALEARALGQATGESVEGILTRLLGMQPTDDLKVMLETHATLFRRLQNFPTVTIDMVLKFSLLRLFRDHPAYPRSFPFIFSPSSFPAMARPLQTEGADRAGQGSLDI